MSRSSESEALAPVVLVISDLGGGGAQRVVTLLANAWADAGRAVTVITLDDGRSDFFGLSPSVRRVALNLLGDSRSGVGALAANLRRVLVLRRALKRSGAKAW